TGTTKLVDAQTNRMITGCIEMNVLLVAFIGSMTISMRAKIPAKGSLVGKRSSRSKVEAIALIALGCRNAEGRFRLGSHIDYQRIGIIAVPVVHSKPHCKRFHIAMYRLHRKQRLRHRIRVESSAWLP